MSDDKTVSQLISKSLRYRVSDQESEEIEKHLEASVEAKKFAELSSLIQESVAGTYSSSETRPDSRDATIGLSHDTKKRLKNSVAEAVREMASLSKAGLIADSGSSDSQTRGSDSEFQHTMPHRFAADDESTFRKITNRFKLQRRLGQGGLGNVWLAQDEQLNRRVAIKELRPEALESPNSWQRFHREAEITGQLEHPNVVPLYQFGTNQTTGEPFYAMRFVGKRTLADAIVEHHDRIAAGESCMISGHRLLTVFLDVCQAIAYAHSRGVVHRDIKPENVALDNFGQVIVLDWGLAKVMEDSELSLKMTTSPTTDSSSVFTQTLEGEVIGTPRFMSPEQAAGRLDEVDEKTDVYGLGAILFAILTGRAPHDFDDVESHSDLKSILKSIAESETPRAVWLNERVPKDLDTICAKAMAHKRHLRYESVQELADAVERWIAGQSEKKANYENLRMEGRELRTELQSYVHNLERNVRFAAGLPPIEQLMKVSTDEDLAVWRERLSSIFRGMLQANPDYQNIAYLKIDGNSFTELVRVERLGDETGKIRTVPKSRLRSDEPNDYFKSVVHKLPEEVLTSLVCDPMCSRDSGCSDAVGLLSAVPVYDDQTEEVFGLVLINCNIDKLLRRQVSRRLKAGEVIVACDIFHTMMHTTGGQISEETLTRKVAEVAPHFVPAVEKLQNSNEFIDSTNSDIYGARLWFIPNKHGVMYLLKAAST